MNPLSFWLWSWEKQLCRECWVSSSAWVAEAYQQVLSGYSALPTGSWREAQLIRGSLFLFCMLSSRRHYLILLALMVSASRVINMFQLLMENKLSANCLWFYWALINLMTQLMDQWLFFKLYMYYLIESACWKEDCDRGHYSETLMKLY